MTKRIIGKLSFMLTLVFVFSIFGNMQAVHFNVYASENIKVYINGELLNFDQPPIIENGRTLVPIRAIAEAFNSFVEWDEDNKAVIIQRGLDTAIFKIGENRAYAKNIHNLDVAAKVVNGRTLIPLRAVSEIFQARVEWDGYTQTVNITSKSFNQEDVINDFTNYGFYKFDYFREAFYEEHVNNSAYPWLRVFSEIGDWGSRIISMPWSSYEKECYKEVIENILNSSYMSEVSQPAEFLPWTNDIVKAIKYNLKLDVNEIKNKYGKSSSEVEGIEFAVDNYGRINDLIKWSNFTLEEVNYLYTDYSHNIKYLNSILYAIEPSNSSKELEKAVLELIDEYTYKWAGLVNDGGKQLVEFLSSKATEGLLGANANLLYSITTFAIEKITELSGITKYSDNVENAMVISMLSSRLIFEFEEMSRLFYDLAATETKKENKWQWKEYVTLFDITKASMVEMYTCMKEVTKSTPEKLYLQQQIDILKNIKINKNLPDMVCDIFSLNDNKENTLVLGDKNNPVNLNGTTYIEKENGFYLKQSNGKEKAILTGKGYDNGFVTDGEVLYYYDKNDVKIKKINVETGKTTSIVDVYRDFTFSKNDPISESYYKEGRILSYNNGWLYFEENHGPGEAKYYVLNVENYTYNKITVDYDAIIDQITFYDNKMYYNTMTYAIDIPNTIYETSQDGLTTKELFDNIYSFVFENDLLYFVQIETPAFDENTGFFNNNHLIAFKQYNLKTKETKVLKSGITYEDYTNKYHYNILNLLEDINKQF